MLYQELIDLIKARRFVEAASRIRSEKPRLKTVSVNHPVFFLLDEYLKSGVSSFMSGYRDLDANQIVVIHRQMEDIMEAMLEGGMDSSMIIDAKKSMSNEEEARSRIGLGSTGEKYQQYEMNSSTLYVRMAGLGWTRGMQVLAKHGHAFDKHEPGMALLNAVRTQQEASIVHLLESHKDLSVRHEGVEADLITRLMNWEGVSANTVSSVMDVYSKPGVQGWTNPAGARQACDATSVEWLALAPGKWKAFHELLLADEASPKRGGTGDTGLWVPLFRHFIRTGELSGLVNEALSDGSFAAWKDRFVFREGVNLASWITQGGALDRTAETRKDYRYGEDPLPVSPTVKMAAQVRRAYRLVDRLQQLGCGLRIGDGALRTEGMDWAALSFVPTPAFVHRHPSILAPSGDGSTALHAASGVDVALGWERLGASAATNDANVDPWVSGMQKADKPAPWAREIGERLKKGLVGLDAAAEGGTSLAAISTKSPPLARLWLKKSKTLPSLEMMEAAIAGSQFALVREWVVAGHLDVSAELRAPVLGIARKPSFGMSDAAADAWRDLLESIKARPARPWPEQVQMWEDALLSSSRGSMYMGGQGNLDKEGLCMLADWGPEARAHWNQSHWDMLPAIVDYSNDWEKILPIELTTDEGVDLFWRVMLTEGQGVTRSDRYSKAIKIWSAFDGVLPVSQAGALAFRKLRELDQSQSRGSFWSAPQGFEQFMQAEDLASASPLPVPSRAPGRRL